MVDVHTELNEFYDDWVRIGDGQRKKLEAARDACLARLNRGMEQLGDERGQNYQTIASFIEQGSFAMETLNQHPRGESDIDIAVIFRKEDLPTTALEARKRVADALDMGGGNFVRRPNARTNAVTVWYADGSHVDFAVYREEKRMFGGTRLEHAGPDWRELDPLAVTEWFAERVETLSPEFLTTVRKHQFRRVVRWVKMFARSRVRWNLPGGMILSALLAETYRPHRKRDDIALYATLKATVARLEDSLVVRNPVDRSHELTRNPKRLAQMKDLLAALADALDELATINEGACTRKKTLRVWGKFFNHGYWREAAVDEPRQRA